MAYRTPRRALRLECLNDRTLPSVTVFEANGVLVVRGDQSANDIVIADDGTANDGAILVTWNGGEYSSQEPVTKICVGTWGGDDTVEYHTTWTLATSRTVFVNLGNNNDSFTANLDYGLSEDTNLKILVGGGNSDDNLTFDGTVDVPESSTLLVRFWGGNGQDNLSTIYSGFLAGSATFVSDGGNGKDNVSGEITLNTFEFVELPGELFPSTGSLRAWMRGNNGVDNIGLNVAGDEGLTKSSLVVNGGHAKDTFSLPTLENDNICIVDQPGDKKNT